jgi:polysaccharide export outer membrane protein
VVLAFVAASASPQQSPDYRVGPGDVLAIDVVGHPELSCAPAVRADGQIRLTGGLELRVRELSPDEIARVVAERLRAETAGPPLEVHVSVSEYRSRFVSVEGAVQRPGRVALRGSTRLVDALIAAGGFAASASGEVVILRDAETDQQPVRRIAVQVAQELQGRGRVDLGLPLRHGDRIAALRLEQVAIGGAVRRPGVLALRDAPTLLSALAAAGGPDRFDRSVELQRRDGAIEEIDIEAVRRGLQPDPELAGGDVISIR